MNLIGLILIAALSGFIVAVSLRLRANRSPVGMWSDAEGLIEQESSQQARARRSWASRAA